MYTDCQPEDPNKNGASGIDMRICCLIVLSMIDESGSLEGMTWR